MGFGFVWWYRKTQRHQDKLLRMQTEEQTPVEKREGPANSYRKWKEEEEAELRQRFREKMTYKALAKAHGRTTGAIKSRLVKLDLIDDP